MQSNKSAKSDAPEGPDAPDEDYRAHLSDPEETPSKPGGVSHLILIGLQWFIQLTYGEQLTDDLINTFCDKVQAAVVDEKLEGFIAIQAIQVSSRMGNVRF